MGFDDVDVVGVGLNATDTVIEVRLYPERGAKVEYERELEQLGGQVASSMMACQGWGLRTRYVGKLGGDTAGDRHEAAFREAGVEARLVRVPGAASARSLIVVDSLGERTVLCRRDERVVLQAAELEPEWVKHARVLLVDGHDTEAATRAAGWAREAGVEVVADLDEVYPGVEELVSLVDHLVVSRDFPSKLTGEPDLHRALQAMAERFGCRLTAATLGADGVLAWDGKRFVCAAAFQVPVVDTTGAGDVFHAGYVYGLLQGWELGPILDFSCAAAALNCTRQGARGGLGPVGEVLRMVREGSRYAVGGC